MTAVARRQQWLLLLASAAASAPGAAQLRTSLPLQPPASWVAAAARGDLLLRDSGTNGPLDARLRPSIGNGLIATIAGSANVYAAGVFLSLQCSDCRCRLLPSAYGLLSAAVSVPCFVAGTLSTILPFRNTS